MNNIDYMKKMKFIIFFFLLISYSIVEANEYYEVTPFYRVKIPDDFYYKNNYRVQWWYFTGQLFDLRGEEYGYELTFFVIDVQKRRYKSKFGVNKLYISHFSLTDVNNRKFLYIEKIDSGIYNFSGAKDDKLSVWVGQDRLEGNYDKFYIKAQNDNIKINLNLKPKKPLVLNGENSYSRKSEDSYLFSSIYFSYTNIEAEGFISINNVIKRVKGKSWFDREIFTRVLSHSQKGWDWFSIRLDNDCEIMLYLLRKRDGTVDRYSSGTIVYRDGTYRHLRLDEFNIKVLSYYKSKKTKTNYPSKWLISIPSERLFLKITPMVKDQEILAYTSINNHYWEGLCKVEESVTGRAYVELTGY